jgi:hypothetical protein
MSFLYQRVKYNDKASNPQPQTITSKQPKNQRLSMTISGKEVGLLASLCGESLGLLVMAPLLFSLGEVAPGVSVN